MKGWPGEPFYIAQGKFHGYVTGKGVEMHQKLSPPREMEFIVSKLGGTKSSRSKGPSSRKRTSSPAPEHHADSPSSRYVSEGSLWSSRDQQCKKQQVIVGGDGGRQNHDTHKKGSVCHYCHHHAYAAQYILGRRGFSDSLYTNTDGNEGKKQRHLRLSANNMDGKGRKKQRHLVLGASADGS